MHLKQMNNINKTMISHHELVKRQEKIAQESLTQTRKIQENQYNDKLKADKEAKDQRMLIYRDTLNYQKQIHDFQRDRLGAMTQVEKEMNRPDLNSFKDKAEGATAMIPGIHNLETVGSTSILRKAYNASASVKPMSDYRLSDPLRTNREIS